MKMTHFFPKGGPNAPFPLLSNLDMMIFWRMDRDRMSESDVWSLGSQRVTRGSVGRRADLRLAGAGAG